MSRIDPQHINIKGGIVILIVLMFLYSLVLIQSVVAVMAMLVLISYLLWRVARAVERIANAVEE